MAGEQVTRWEKPEIYGNMCYIYLLHQQPSFFRVEDEKPCFPCECVEIPCSLEKPVFSYVEWILLLCGFFSIELKHKIMESMISTSI